MKWFNLFRASLITAFRKPWIILAHTAACFAIFGFVTFLGRGSDSARMLPGVTGSAAVNLAAGMPALLCEHLARRAREGGVMHRLALSPAGAGRTAFAMMGAAAFAGLLESALILVFALVLGAPFAPRMLLALPAALPEILFFSAVGLWAGCLLSRNAAWSVCGLGVSVCGVWLSHLLIDPSLLPSRLAEAVSVTPHAAFTTLIHAFYCPGAPFSPGAALLSGVYALAGLFIGTIAVSKRMGEREDENRPSATTVK